MYHNNAVVICHHIGDDEIVKNIKMRYFSRSLYIHKRYQIILTGRDNAAIKMPYIFDKVAL
jgi:hypothetical protein